MSYSSVASQAAKEPIYILEMEVDFCSNSYGVAPCTASKGAGEECYNTYPTCQDRSNFDETNLAGDPDAEITKRMYRFANHRKASAMQAVGDPVVFPTLISVDTTPTRLDPGRGIGARASCSIELVDNAWTDVSIDPYYSTRGVNQFLIGSFWGKFLARNSNYEGRVMNLYTGFLDEDGQFNIANFNKRTYLISKISGPNSNGGVRIEGRDPLKFADEDRGQFPPPPRATIGADITDAETTIAYTDNDAGVVDWLDTGQPYIRINDEIMEVTGYTATSLTVVRATMPAIYEAATNQAEAHTQGASIQLCYHYNGISIQNVIKHLLGVANVPSVYIDKNTDWDTKISSAGYDSYLMYRLLTAPEAIKKYLTELAQHNVSIYWNERDTNIELSTLSLSSLLPDVVNETDNIISGSISVTKNTKNRLTEVWLGHGYRNPTYRLDEDISFSIWNIRADLGAESRYEYKDVKINKVRSPWLNSSQVSVAGEIANRTLIDNRDTKTRISVSFDPKDGGYWTGDVVGVSTRLVQDKDGSNLEVNYSVIEAREVLSQEGIGFSYILEGRATLTRTGVITPNLDPRTDITLVHDGDVLTHNGDVLTYSNFPAADFPDYSAASSELKAQYAFIAYNDRGDGKPGFTDGTEPYEVTV